MSREECAALLRNLQLGLDGLQREVDDLLSSLPEVKTADLGRALASQKERLQGFAAEQSEEWERVFPPVRAAAAPCPCLEERHCEERGQRKSAHAAPAASRLGTAPQVAVPGRR